ncbi:MAG: hypothetical protein RLN62_00210 [Rickettsiales bacterium]
MSQQEFLLSFARRIGKRLSPLKKNFLDRELKKRSINNLDLTSKKQTVLEIGSGMGDFLSVLSRKNPNINFIASEPYLNGIVSLLEKSDSSKNLYIWPDDVRLLIKKIPDQCLDLVYILFPDPWPRKNQQKRRLVSQYLLKILHPKLKHNSSIKIATDDPNYAKWIILKFIGSKSFIWKQSKNFLDEFEEFTQTKYYKRSLHKPYFLEFSKI